MSVYVIESDKLFLCCKDGVMGVYEIDSLYIAPVQQKHWTLVATIHSAKVESEYEVIKIGDKEIKGHELEVLTQDLACLGMMVNCEGLCFLKTETNVSEVYQVDYYRMFDLFDWSKYHVKSCLNTKWVCNDIITGRPLMDRHMKLLKENRIEHLEELLELHCKHKDDIKELKRTHNEYAEELKRTHLAELAEFQHSKEEELKLMQDELEIKETSIKILAEEVKLYCYKKSNAANIFEFFSKLVSYLQSSSGRLRMYSSIPYNSRNICFYQPLVNSLLLVPVGEASFSNFPGVYVSDIGSLILLDCEHWRCIEVELMSIAYSPSDFVQLGSGKTLMYYDGNKYTGCAADRTGTFPPPYPEVCPSELKGGGVYRILGVGLRFGFINMPKSNKK